MTTLTEIEELEKDFKAINECGPAWPALDGLLKAMKVYLSLLKGEHETDVIVPRSPTVEMMGAGKELIPCAFQLSGELRRHAAQNVWCAMIRKGENR